MSRNRNAGMVIIGAGHCGGRAALSLRESGWQGDITLIGEEVLLPYERPALSKGLLAGLVELEDLHLMDRSGWLAAGIQLRLGQRVEAIDRQNKTVRLSDGELIHFHRLLLATGGKARLLTIAGSDHPNVVTLRNHADAMTLKARLKPDSRVVVIGGGFIGLEIAATACDMGCDVTLVEGSDRLLSRAVPPVIACRVQILHQQRGVTLSFGCLPEEILHFADGSSEIVLQNGCHIKADIVIAGVGMLPCTELAKAAGLDVEQGILVDNLLRTRDPDIYAAGDVCQFPAVLSGKHLRQETWLNAETQARLAAVNMAGGTEPYQALPWFWSDQYDHTLQVCGEPSLAVKTIVRTLADNGLLIFYLNADDQLVGCSGFGLQRAVNKELKIARKLVERQSKIDFNLLSDGNLPLKKCLSAA